MIIIKHNDSSNTNTNNNDNNDNNNSNNNDDNDNNESRFFGSERPIAGLKLLVYGRFP